MGVIDLHCDTASRMYYEDLKLKKSICKVDIEKLMKAQVFAQVFAHFIDIKSVDNPYEEFLRMNKNLIEEIRENNSNIEIVTNLKELECVSKRGKIGAFLAIEEGEVLQGKVERLQEVYNLGVRFITLTWNYPNSLGYPNFEYEYKNIGLTKQGEIMVCEMEKLGIIPDCSHLSDKGFYDLIDICKKPFIATHSNARSVKEHPRNLTDDMIVRLSNKGGVMGLNFCSDFLGEKEVSSIEDMIRHLKYIRNVGGIDVIALGTDYDGIGNEVEVENIGEINVLKNRLSREGFTSKEIDKMFYENVKRVLRECL